MLKISKNIVLDENQKPIAVQIPIDEFERLEEIIENYGLAKMMDEVRDDERLSLKEAKNYYQSLIELNRGGKGVLSPADRL
ncbi:MAG: hypothetical protein U9N18_04540 [Campylobacterota bacterium]|nr:hypothetical protein [Campylobacterota bacterium]